MIALTDKHAVVTGANRGIGAEIARALSKAGARVTLLVRDAAKADAVTRTLTTPCAVVQADVADAVALRRALTDAEAALGPMNILVNNAGHALSAPFLKTDPLQFKEMLDVHLMAVVHAAQAVLPGMVARGSGTIVNVASVAGLEAVPYVSAYVAAKHAEVGLTKALAAEFAGQGIRVHAICPGYVDTDLVTGAVERVVAKTGRSASEALAGILAGVQQSRLVAVAEVAEAVVGLMDPSVPTGRIVVLDGRTPA